MNENINLCEILKGHEGETFYSSALGYVTLRKVLHNTLIIVSLKYNSIGFKVNAKEIVEYLFPSKEQRDWNKWVEEHKVPKTWSELVEANKQLFYEVAISGIDCKIKYTPIEKSALALLKIHQLIEVGYGGNITNEEWNDLDIYVFFYKIHKDDNDNPLFVVYRTNDMTTKTPVAFHTKEQAEEFLKYPENIQLLKDYFMI